MAEGYRRHNLNKGEEEKRNKEIAKLFYKDKIPMRTLAYRFNISSTLVSKIVREAEGLYKI